MSKDDWESAKSIKGKFSIAWTLYEQQYWRWVSCQVSTKNELNPVLKASGRKSEQLVWVWFPVGGWFCLDIKVLGGIREQVHFIRRKPCKFGNTYGEQGPSM